MAIDDNTSYELTGAQVKDLASKINGKADASSVPAAQVNSDWDATSGVAEILNKPTIPTVNDATLTITQNGTSAGTFTANASSDATIALTDTTYSNFVGTDGTTDGAAGLVPAPTVSDSGLFLKSDGTWDAAGSSSNGVDTFYGTCSTSYSTYSKVVTTSSDFEYRTGIVLFVKFTYYSYYSSTIYLNVNNTGTKSVYVNGNTTNSSYLWKSNDVVGFVYDGSAWRMLDSDKADTSYYGKVKIGSSYTSSSSDTVPTSNHLYQVYTLANNKQDRLIAGTGITISGNTISATGGNTYTYSGAVDTANNKFTTTLTDQSSNAQNVTLNAGAGIAFSTTTSLGAVGPTIVPNTTAAYYADITSLTFTPTNANLGYFFVLRVYKEYQMATSTYMYQATLYMSNATYSYSSEAEVTAAISNEQIIVNPDSMAFSNYFTQINQSSFQSDAATAISQVSGVPANFGGTIDDFSQATYVDVYVYTTNLSSNVISGNVYTAGSGISITNNVISATGGGGGGITGDDAVVIADGAIANAFYSGTVTGNNEQAVTVSIPTQASTNYRVAITPTSYSANPFYVANKTTTGFDFYGDSTVAYDFIVFGQMATPNADLAELSDPDSINSGDIRGELEELTTISI